MPDQTVGPIEVAARDSAERVAAAAESWALAMTHRIGARIDRWVGEHR